MRRYAFTLVELLVVIAIIGILIGLLLPAVQSIRESARRAACQNKIRQVALGLEHYHSQHNRFPFGWNEELGTNSTGWGWMAYTLPFVEQENLAQQIEFQVDIRDPQFEQLIQSPLKLLFCPSSPDLNRKTFLLDGDNTNLSEEEFFPATVARSQYVGCIGTLTTAPNIIRGM